MYKIILKNTIKTKGETMNKGELMQLIYSKKELCNIDPSLPIELLSEIDNSYFYVMNYNNNIFGQLDDMRTIAARKYIII